MNKIRLTNKKNDLYDATNRNSLKGSKSFKIKIGKRIQYKKYNGKKMNIICKN